MQHAATRPEPGPRPPVLFLIHDLGIGGAERAFLAYVGHLRRTQPIPVLIRRRIDLQDGVAPSGILDLGRPSTSSLFSRSLVGGAVALVRKVLRLNAIRRQTNAYVLSTFLHKSHLLGLALKLVVPRLRVVVNIHEHLSQHLEHHFPPGRRWLMRRLLVLLLPRADRVVAVGEGIRRDLVESFGLPPDQVVVVPNPVDLDRIRNAGGDPVPEVLFDHGEPVLVTAGRLVPLKGVDLLLHAMAEIAGRTPCRLLVLGNGPERPVLEALSRDLGLEDRVTFLGMQENPWRYMARADAFVLSSRTEGRPLALTEALALGLPVVAAHCSPGVAEALHDGRLGLLVPPEDAGALASALSSLLEDTDLRRELGRRASAGVEVHRFGPAIARYDDLIAGLAQRSPV